MNNTLVVNDGIVIGSGYFGNFRRVREQSERVCFAISLATNGVLALMLVREKHQVMKPYSRVLLINVFFDVVFTLVSMLLEMEDEMNDGFLVYVINGAAIKHLSPDIQKLSLPLHVWSCQVVMVPAMEFIFRYCLVVKRYILSTKQLFAMSTFLSFLALIDALFLYLAAAEVGDHQAVYGSLMTHPMWHVKGESTVFYAANSQNFFFMCFVGFTTILDAVTFVILITTSVFTLRELRRNRHRMSANTRYMQSQLNRLMLAEVISVIGVAIVPVFTLTALLFLKVKYVGFGVLINIALQWIPAINPLTTMLLVGPYRRQVFGRMCDKVQASETTVTAVDSGLRTSDFTHH